MKQTSISTRRRSLMLGAAATALTYTAANLYVRANDLETGFEKWTATPAPGGFVAL